MPRSKEQRRIMDINIKANTIYNWHSSGTDSYTARTYIINCLEKLVDSKRNVTRDLFLPNCFIDGCENSSFWFKMALTMSGSDRVCDWHELEYGPPLNRVDIRQKYVYTWKLNDELYRFYTRKLCDGYTKELAWYANKSVCSDEACDSGEDTESEDIMLRVHP